jgi:hypothetical protein
MQALADCLQPTGRAADVPAGVVTGRFDPQFIIGASEKVWFSSVEVPKPCEPGLADTSQKKNDFKLTLKAVNWRLRMWNHFLLGDKRRGWIHWQKRNRQLSCPTKIV